MKISKRSWHYRMLKHLNGQDPCIPTLCDYVGELFGAFVLCGMVIALLPIWGPICGFVLLLQKMEGQRTKPKEPGLFRSWLRARVERVCPLVEFED